MQWVYRISDGDGCIPVVGPANAGLQHLSLDILRLKAQQTWSWDSGEEEAVLVVLSGKCAVSVAGRHAVAWSSVGGRPDIFSGPPGAIYIPRRTAFSVAGVVDTEVAMFRAKCDLDLEAALVQPGDVAVVSLGAANWHRDARMIFGAGDGRTGRLIVGETFNPPGNWSGIPPHKHDSLGDQEFPLEEIYLFKTLPADCFAVQLSYGGQESNLASMVGNNDVAVFRSGYHPTVSSPGVQLCYVWALAGSARTYRIFTDPRYRWVPVAEAVLRENGRR